MKSTTGPATTLMAIMLFVFVCVSPESQSTASASGTPLTRDYFKTIERGERLAANPSIEMLLIGTVDVLDSQFPVYSFQRRSQHAKAIQCLLTGAIHGNEPAGGEALYRFLELLADDPGLYPEVSFTVVPIQNPYGWVHNVRGTYDGEDINRDFASKRTQEASLLRSFFSESEYSIAIDHHEDPNSAGCYVYEYAPGEVSYAPLFVEYLERSQLPVEQEVSFSILKVANGIISAPMWGLWFQKLTRKLSSTNWLRLQKIRHTYTIETPLHLNFDTRVDIHLHTLQLFVDAHVSSYR